MTTQEPFGEPALAPRDVSANGADALPVDVRSDARSVAAAVAREIADAIRENPGVVLGLATGGTMVGVYAELVRIATEESLDVTGVTTFNLDEYMGLEPGGAHSFRRFMDEHLFVPAGFDPARTRFPDTARASTDPLGAARAYEDEIAAAGGIEIQLLGVGRNGHIAFNEPGSPRASRTRVVELDETTRGDAAAAFGGLASVPHAAMTVGIATILEARGIRVLALGEHKAPIVARVVEGDVGPDVPATFLRAHADARLLVDAAAASHLVGR